MLIGSDVVSRVFGDTVDPVGENISVGPGKYLVVGVLKSKGASMMTSNNSVSYTMTT